jgi:protein-tyrosine kinase
MFRIGALLGRPKRSTSTALRTTDGTPYSPIREDEIVGVLSAIRTALPQKRWCTLGVISTLPGEGTSSVATALANAAANNPRTKVLLCKVPKETWAPQQSSPAPFIFMETINTGRSDRLIKGRLNGLHAVSDDAGAQKSIMRSLTSQFDLVIVDLPPVSESTLAQSLTRGLDGVVLVVEAERTRAHALRAARRSIESSGGNIVGVVLNKRRLHIPQFIYRRL